MEYKNKGFDGLMEMLIHAANLLINTAPRPDGSIVPIDIQVFKQMGKYIRENGFPQKSQE